MISIILLEPEHPGNIGAIARVMANFDFDKLVIVNPKCDPRCEEAINRSKHGKHVLEKAKVLKRIPKQDYLIATTAKLGTDYNLRRTPLTPEQSADKLAIVKNRKVGVLIGRESYGLFNEEIEKCDFVVTIPASKKYSTLNISHSVAVIVYELHKKLGKRKSNAKITPISYAEKKQINKMFNHIFKKLDWKTKEKKQTQQTLWKRIMGKAMLSKREAYAVMGFLRKLIK